MVNDSTALSPFPFSLKGKKSEIYSVPEEEKKKKGVESSPGFYIRGSARCF